MIECFNTGVDIHWMTALSEIARGMGEQDLVFKAGKALGIKDPAYPEAIEAIKKAGPKKCEAIDPAWKMVRYKAKAVNFGFLYGMRPAKFQEYARNEYGIKLSEEQSQESFDAYHDLYHGLDSWYARQRRQAREHGYVITLTGRRRRLPDAQLYEDCPERESAFRQAINSPVQGFANEYLFMCAREVRARFTRRVLRIIGTVHDSMLVLIRPGKVEQVVPEILEIMKKPALLEKMGIRLRVPIEAECAIGPWGSGVSLEEWCSKSARAR
jgi:DNA polymerase I-like protein with 3'-5' exonuclease and polymerase domains